MVCSQGGLSGIHRGGIKFGGLGMQGHPGISLVRNIFKCSFTEYGKGSGRYIFEGGFKFSASEARKKFDIISSSDWGATGE